MIRKALTALAFATQAVAQTAPRTTPPTVLTEARPYHVRALMSTGQLTTDSALALLDARHFSQSFKQATPNRRALVEQLRVRAAEASNIRVNEDSAGVHIHLSSGTSATEVLFRIDPNPPFQITTLELRAASPQPQPPAGPPLTWETLAPRLRDLEAAGVSGQILVRRAGTQVLRTSFGFADKERNRRSAADDVYCIGSTPIDFTSTAARLLAHRGKLDLDAPITRWFPNVPADKATITPRMILDLRSGLANFHDRDSDWDPDLAYISRDEAVRRILAAPLVAPPGGDRRNSHSAFGLLAAIVEIASGQSYQDFIRNEIFRPLGMTRTGFYGETLGLTAEAFATGYGTRSAGAPNIPPNWGPTSWLVMGSGGMTSTLDDLRRYYDGIAAGILFGGQKPQPRLGAALAGSDRGFLFMRVPNAQGDEVLFLSNTEGNSAVQPFVRSLIDLVQGRR